MTLRRHSHSFLVLMNERLCLSTMESHRQTGLDGAEEAGGLWAWSAGATS